MLTIDGNNIKLTRGDTLALEIKLTQEIDPVPPATEPTIEPYIPAADDVIRFAVSKGYKGQTDYELKFSVELSHDLSLVCGPDKTALDYYVYNYDVEITFADGRVETPISGTLEITGEVK